MTAHLQTSLTPDLDWLRQVLWPDDACVRARLDADPAEGWRRVATYGLAPSARRARLLVPLAGGRVTRAAFRQFNDSMSQRARIAKAAAGIVASSPVPAVVRDRLFVDVAAHLGDEELATLLPERFVGRVLGHERVAVAVSFGSLRPNRKPVLQAILPDGRVVGFAKVAWNDLTSRLVANESRVLRDWSERPPSTFWVPSLLHEGAWRDRNVSITSPVPQRVWRMGPVMAAPPAEVVREIAERDGVGAASFADVPFWRDVRGRISALPAGETGDRARDLATRVETAFGDVEVPVGAWHGDLAPWNMSRGRDGTAIWDWERARPGVPAGLDVAHLAFQLALRATGREPAASAHLAADRGAAALRGIGVDPDLWPLVGSVYLFELFLRYQEASAEGVLSRTEPMRATILAALEATARRDRR